MARFLFTTLTSNDLGLLTRTLPIAEELAARGYQIAFCNPARAPSKLLALIQDYQPDVIVDS